MATEKATEEQKRMIHHYVTPGRFGGTVTGLWVGEDEETITVRMYSAGCLHGRYVLKKCEGLEIRPY